MIPKTNEQSLYDAFLKLVMSLDFRVYDDAPAGAKMPYVEIEGTQHVNVTNKTATKGSLFLMFSVWGLPQQRAEVSYMANKLMDEAKSIAQEGPYRWQIYYDGSDIVMDDNTDTGTKRKRAMATLQYLIK